jgi:hypothetical protein
MNAVDGGVDAHVMDRSTSSLADDEYSWFNVKKRFLFIHNLWC